MNCEFTAPYPELRLRSSVCALAYDLSLADVDSCVNNADDELDLAERRGTQLTQAINFIPSIVFNDVFDLTLHRQVLSRLTNMVCLAVAADSTTGVTNC